MKSAWTPPLSSILVVVRGALPSKVRLDLACRILRDASFLMSCVDSGGNGRNRATDSSTLLRARPPFLPLCSRSSALYVFVFEMKLILSEREVKVPEGGACRRDARARVRRARSLHSFLSSAFPRPEFAVLVPPRSPVVHENNASLPCVPAPFPPSRSSSQSPSRSRRGP